MNLLPAVAVLVFTLASVACVTQVLRLPFSQGLRPRARTHRNVLRRPNALKIPVRSPGPLPDPPPTPTPKDVKLVNFNNKFYYGPITIGTPGQEFNVAFGTDTPSTWIPTVHSPPENLAHHHCRRYDNTSSSTYRANGQEFSLVHTLGLVNGYLSRDSVTIGDITAKNQIFGEAVLLPDGLQDDILTDGIIGLGKRDYTENDHLTVFDNMVSQGLLPDSVFSFYLNRFDTADPESVLTLGGTNPSYYTGKFTFADIVAPHRWQFRMDGVQVSELYGIFSPRPFQAVVDSGTSMIVGPMEITDHLNENLGGKPLPGWPKMYEFDCDVVGTLPDVEFVVNGETLSVSSKDYILKLQGEGQTHCYSAILGRNMHDEEAPVWILGTPFMRAYYTQFDAGNNRVGFAKAKHTKLELELFG
ncbi:cathepsin d [Plakobranchus ocellatus]|uniref:Cathepsin d n=1 Tax=Plakobranchus ocellatus TaxID=259542 RepID=A0AAV3ZX81_9GAST|nr:cathepsin d [Plakobranchus ocellatus]